ncbi:hypothetical protein AKJ16_DCAP23483 [Drosera capensis]
MPKMVGNEEPGAAFFKIMLGSFSKMLAASAPGIHSRYWYANVRCARRDSEESRRRILEGEDGENWEMLLLLWGWMGGVRSLSGLRAQGFRCGFSISI